LLKAKLRIICKDIEEHTDECLINAANELLLGGGGVDGVVHKLGGEGLIQEVLKIPLNSFGARIMEGQAV
jgi:O-acetyl-ADP-ribose deacetylase (regulator of RNase III)